MTHTHTQRKCGKSKVYIPAHKPIVLLHIPYYYTYHITTHTILLHIPYYCTYHITSKVYIPAHKPIACPQIDLQRASETL